MNPITHILVSWSVANTVDIGPRDRLLVVLAGSAADLDGLGAIAEVLTRDSDKPLLWFSEYHHVLCHNVGFGIFAVLLGLVLGKHRLLTGFLCLLVFHLHILGDLVGARGPDGSQWPIPYLLPFSREPGLVWSGQWALNAWPNILLTVVLLALTFYLAWRKGFSPLEMVSRRADRIFVETLRRRFPMGDEGQGIRDQGQGIRDQGQGIRDEGQGGGTESSSNSDP